MCVSTLIVGNVKIACVSVAVRCENVEAYLSVRGN
jgi:hypothetical protein